MLANQFTPFERKAAAMKRGEFDFTRFDRSGLARHHPIIQNELISCNNLAKLDEKLQVFVTTG